MIIGVEGILEDFSTLSCAINVNGIIYEILIPINTQLPNIGEKVKLFIYDIYREDSQTLYGFSTLAERDFFKLIVEKVSGVGPRTALGMLSRYSLDEIQQSIVLKDITALSKLPGIGKKTAEKIVLELADQISIESKISLSAPKSSNAAAELDAVLGLVALGYKKTEAEQKIRTIAQTLPQASADILIKAAIAIK